VRCTNLRDLGGNIDLDLALVICEWFLLIIRLITGCVILGGIVSTHLRHLFPLLLLLRLLWLGSFTELVTDPQLGNNVADQE